MHAHIIQENNLIYFVRMTSDEKERLIVRESETLEDQLLTEAESSRALVLETRHQWHHCA